MTTWSISTRLAAVVLALLAMAGIALSVGAVATWRSAERHPSEVDAAAVATLTDIGQSLRDEIARAVAPAISRTRKLSHSTEIADALRKGNRAVLMQTLNEAITASTEVDAIALFDATGTIVAINSVYAGGDPIAPERVARIMSMKFDGREIIQGCVRNDRDDPILEFQTTCDITPAFFDSSGLSVAYSEPVRDPATGVKLGVVSTRLRFERLTELLRDRVVAGRRDAVYFVGDDGAYFSEAINRKSQEPPLSRRDVNAITAQLVSGTTNAVFSMRGDRYVSVFAMRELQTLDNGGIYVMLLADSAWVRRGAIAARRVSASVQALCGVLLIAVAVMLPLLVTFRRQHRKLLGATASAEAASIAKSAFLANMSHEIRTPMTAILGYTEVLEGGQQTDTERLESIRIIRSNGEHLLSIINDVLNLAKIEAGKVVIKTCRFALCGLVSEVAALMNVRAAGKGLRLDVQFVLPLPEEIESDPLRLRQILLNLVGNAIKFTEIGSVVIRVRRDAKPGAFAIEVSDSGIGLTPDQIATLFRPFAQADESMTRRYGGTGLGLTISRRYAQLLGGDITVQSTPGVGSTFATTFQARVTSEHQIVTKPPAVERSGPAHTIATAPSGPAPRVLLAEDGLDNQRLISMHLRKAGHEVLIVGDGRCAVEAVQRHLDQGTPFDLILMDMQMPDLDGYGATRELRRRGITTPVIALTAHAMEGDREKCLEAGCTDYATKPIDRATLLGLCNRWACARAAA